MVITTVIITRGKRAGHVGTMRGDPHNYNKYVISILVTFRDGMRVYVRRSSIRLPTPLERLMIDRGETKGMVP